ncbi:AAA family ATPase [Carnobacteriaceae bacterium zg-C25]|nr:AAA family ATPase [Carnobacteriaceae bacterium zg-C25]
MSSLPRLVCYLFGHPVIKLNDEVVTFSFSKVNALLYYLLVNRVSTRDEVAGLLWPDKSEMSAKKNLRNTIYQANKVLGDDFIFSTNHKTIEINPNYPVFCDVDAFQSDDKDALSYYQDVFLKGFFVKDSEDYDLWIVKMRTHFEQMFIKRSYDKIVDDIQNHRYDGVELDIHRLIAIDEFDERHYQLLMNFYFDTNRHSKVIETYYQLVDLLDRELNVLPNRDTRLIYEKTLQVQNKLNQTTKPLNRHVFYGRYDELQQLEENSMRLFNNTHQHIVLEGVSGVGKSALVNTVLQRLTQPCYQKVVICHRSEQQSPLRVIKRLMDELQEICVSLNMTTTSGWNSLIKPLFPKNTLERQAIDDIELMLYDVLHRIQLEQPLILILDDIHFLDYESAMVLNRLMLNLKHQKVLFILTVQPTKNTTVENVLNNLFMNEQLISIPMSTFTKEEVSEYVKKRVDESYLSEGVIDTVYQESEGLPFFVNEYITLLKKNISIDRVTLKMQEFIKEQFNYFNDLQLDVLTVLSYFNHFGTIEMIKEVLDYELELVEETIDLALHSGVLVEQDKGHSLAFTHKKFKEYFYSKQTYTKKRMIHKKIAVILEKQIHAVYSADLLSEVVRHYQEANLPMESMRYWLKKIDLSLATQHDVFPIYKMYQRHFEGLNAEELKTELALIDAEMDKLKKQYAQNMDYQQLSIQRLLLKGKYYIRFAQYELGLELIEQVIIQAKAHQQIPELFEAYRQMIYYYLQVDNPEQLIIFVRKAMQLAVDANNYEQMGMLLRIEGVYYMMTGEFEKAEKQLHESIHIYSITSALFEKYKSNIAAAYDYLAETARIQNDLHRAVTLHTSSLDLMESEQFKASTIVFLLNRGITYLQQGRYDKALNDLMQAKTQNKTVHSLWKAIQLDGYYALCQYHLGQVEDLKNFITRYNENDAYSNPRDKGLVLYLKAIAQQNGIMDTNVSNSETNYLEQAKKYLSVYRDAHLCATIL